MANDSTPPTSAVAAPTSTVLMMAFRVAGLANSRSKWSRLYCFMSISEARSRTNRNLRNAATISARLGSTTTTSR